MKLFKAGIEVTYRCNLNCRFCYLGDRLNSRPDIPLKKIFNIVDQISTTPCVTISLMGGEPFIREDFLDLLDYSHKKGLVTCVSTNGVALDRSIARRLSSMNMLYLQISLDGADEETNDRIRGRGTYKKVINAIEALVSNNVKFSINTVLTRTNFEQLETLRAMAYEYGAELRVSRFRPSGRGKSSKADLGPTPEQLEYFAEWLEKHGQNAESLFCFFARFLINQIMMTATTLHADKMPAK